MSDKKKVRVWADGCFDMVHFGHANAIRQAKLMGDELVVGVHSDSEIEKNKGPPVFTEQERYKLVRSIKWVDEVVEGAPYVTELEMLDEHNCDFCVHGDDITLSGDMEDCYHKVKKVGRYKECKRTQGVSTTDLVGRMLLATKTHFSPGSNEHGSVLQGDSLRPLSPPTAAGSGEGASPPPASPSPYTKAFPFLQTTQTILEFSDRHRRVSGQKIVYVAGDFDLFHVGHVDFLEEAAKLGDFLVVGLHTDQSVNSYKGLNYPIMNLNERVLSVLANRNVCDVVIGAPYEITKGLMETLGVDVVCCDISAGAYRVPNKDGDPYVYPKSVGKYKEVDTGNKLTTETIVQRIIDHRVKFETRNAKKEARELANMS